MRPTIRTIVIITFLALCLTLSACSSIGAASMAVATYTPLPTYTAYPTYTPLPTESPAPKPTPTPNYQPITWIELNDFLAGDHTNWHAYDFETYNCVNFAMELVTNARAAGINAWIVTVEFKDSNIGHAFVAFPTIDKGNIWIEPQSDYAYAEVEVGQPLCLKMDPTRCQDWGVVSRVDQPAECDWYTHECWHKK